MLEVPGDKCVDQRSFADCVGSSDEDMRGGHVSCVDPLVRLILTHHLAPHLLPPRLPPHTPGQQNTVCITLQLLSFVMAIHFGNLNLMFILTSVNPNVPMSHIGKSRWSCTYT